MRLERLILHRYRKARYLEFDLQSGLNVLIGPNASGKSNILDSLRFLADAAREGSFRQPLVERGGFNNIAWKGENATNVVMELYCSDSEQPDQRFQWAVRLNPSGRELVVSEEDLHKVETRVLDVSQGVGWWWSDASQSRERLRVDPAECALSAAAKNEAFPGRPVHDFIKRWTFCDPSPWHLRLPSTRHDPDTLDTFGRNLAARLDAIRENDSDLFDAIRQAVSDITGVHITAWEVRPIDDMRLALSIREEGLKHTVNQPALSAGTLRLTALVVALMAPPEEGQGLVAIEEPENYLHPAALEALVDLVVQAAKRMQILLTTHSPLLLNYITEEPGAVLVVGSNPDAGTWVRREADVEHVREALAASGFGLGDYWLTKGFRGEAS